jgi:hypothetical protein
MLRNYGWHAKRMGGAVASQGYVKKFRTDSTRRLRGVFYFMMFYVRSQLIQPLALRNCLDKIMQGVCTLLHYLKEVCKVKPYCRAVCVLTCLSYLSNNIRCLYQIRYESVCVDQLDTQRSCMIEFIHKMLSALQCF